MAITQYVNDNSYSSISSDIQNLVANKVGLFDQYVLIQTGQYEYTALVRNAVTRKVKQIKIYRTNTTGYSGNYTVQESTASDFAYNVSNEYYAYSNVNIGRSLNLPVYEGTTAFCLSAITCFCFFAVVFKGVFFKCLRNRKR